MSKDFLQVGDRLVFTNPDSPKFREVWIVDEFICPNYLRYEFIEDFSGMLSDMNHA